MNNLSCSLYLRLLNVNCEETKWIITLRLTYIKPRAPSLKCTGPTSQKTQSFSNLSSCNLNVLKVNYYWFRRSQVHCTSEMHSFEMLSPVVNIVINMNGNVERTFSYSFLKEGKESVTNWFDWLTAWLITELSVFDWLITECSAYSISPCLPASVNSNNETGSNYHLFFQFFKWQSLWRQTSRSPYRKVL